MQKVLFIRWVFPLLATFTIICYLSVLIPPTFFWPAVFASYAIPAVLLVNAILLPVTLFFYRRKIFYPLLGLLAGVPFVLVTYSHHRPQPREAKMISVLSLNAKLFRKSRMYNEFSTDLISWVAADSSDIKCFQEYSTNARWEPLDVTGQIKKQGFNGFIHRATMDGAHNPGLAIFSKYPILDTGTVWIRPGSLNDGIFVDIDLGYDTVRIYNVHLESMKLLLYQYKNAENYPWKMKHLVSRLKDGAAQRSYQIDRLITHTRVCPHPFIICGDFNETPYSFNYFLLRQHFSNAFEQAGRGFGFSLNSVLFFLRIDHHFYGPGIEALDYRVDRSMKVSDHFPTRGRYTISR
ncbi:MAG: endonuclease/exonuclease/phosphatase family protein [Cyclobacteriaceae bacterium]|nr:endonuclease/exonuclease/phosphatase family protein [Cyclobacteriaceae bacterium]